MPRDREKDGHHAGPAEGLRHSDGEGSESIREDVRSETRFRYGQGVFSRETGTILARAQMHAGFHEGDEKTALKWGLIPAPRK